MAPAEPARVPQGGGPLKVTITAQEIEHGVVLVREQGLDSAGRPYAITYTAAPVVQSQHQAPLVDTPLPKGEA